MLRSLASRCLYIFPKIALIIEVVRRCVNKSAPSSRATRNVLHRDYRPDRFMGFQLIVHLKERSSATVDTIAPFNFPDFSCTNFRSENECRGAGEARRERREGGTCSHEGRKEPPSTIRSRIHACTYQYRPCMTRRLTGHADKNEEELLSHSNRATFRSEPDTRTKSRHALPSLYTN